MSDSHEIKNTAAQPQPHDEHPVDFNNYLRRCSIIFVAILCAIALMLWISYLSPEHYSWAIKTALILIVASLNASVVAGFLMHLISEKKMVYTVLGFTAIFVLGLFWLTIYAMQDFPLGTTMH